MRNRIPHSRPTIGPQEERAVVRVLRSAQLGTGEALLRFEEALGRFVGTGRATAVQSGSAALHLALLALRIKPGDRVLLPTYTCAAVLNAVKYVHGDPILADVDPATANLDPDDVKRRLRPRTRAMIVPHMFGRRAPVGELRRLGVPVIEDCAMALAKGWGRAGDLSVFSFYATKMIATGQGGAVWTRDSAKARDLQDLVDYDNRDEFRVRYNYRMSALAAAVGRAQLARVPDFVKQRRRIAEYYYRTLELGEPPRDHLFYRFVLRVGSVERFVRFMASRGVESKRPVYRPLHRYFAGSSGEYPGAEELHRSWASLPLYPSLRRAEMERVGKAAREFLD